MKRESNTGIIIGITAAAAAVLAIMIAGLVFVFPIVKEKCTDFFVDQKLEQGYKYLSQQDYKPAIAAFNTVVKVDDKRAEAYIGLGDAYSGRKDWVPAANYYSLAIDNVQNSADSIESASFANDYLAQSGSRVEKDGKTGLSASSINNHSGNTTIVNQELLQVLVDKRNNAIDCGREKNDSAQGCTMKPAEESVTVEGPDSEENVTSDDIPAQEGEDPSDGISTADDLYPSDDIVIDDETQSGEDAENVGDIETDDDDLSCENETGDQVEQGAIKEEPSSANDTDEADEENDEDFDESTNEQPDENAEDISGESPEENTDDSTGELPDEKSEDEFAANEHNALEPYMEVIDKLKEEHGEIRMTKSIQDPDDPAIGELNGVCLLTLLDMDGMGEKELFAVCKNDTDTSYKGIIYTIKDNKAVTALEIGNTASTWDGYDYTVCIHRYNNRDYILTAEYDESGSYSISGYIGDKYTTVKYSYEAAYASEEEEEELTDPEESDPSADDEDPCNDEEADNDEDSGDWDDTGDEEESYNDEDSGDWDQSYEDEDAYNDEESEDWTESEDVDTGDDEESEDWDESYDSYDEDTYDVSYRGGKAAFTNCTCRVDPKSHKAINCTANDVSETDTYNYYINNEPVDEAVFTEGLAGFGLSMSGSNGEDTDYFLAGAKEDIQQQELTDLISDTETEIREGMKMS